MPFIIQCPYRKCRKFNLLEDTARGTQVECLVCKGLIKVDASGAGERPEASSPGHQPARPTPHAQRQNIANCPRCGTLLRVPPNAAGKNVKCPRCQTIFAP
jgi:predicted Zn finger-like uncharacterized protein